MTFLKNLEDISADQYVAEIAAHDRGLLPQKALRSLTRRVLAHPGSEELIDAHLALVRNDPDLPDWLARLLRAVSLRTPQRPCDLEAAGL